MQEKTLLCSRETERDNMLCAGRNLIFHWREIYRLHIKFSWALCLALITQKAILPFVLLKFTVTLFFMEEQCDNKQTYTLLLNSLALLSLLWSSAIRLISNSTNPQWATCPSLSLLMKQLRDGDVCPSGAGGDQNRWKTGGTLVLTISRWMHPPWFQMNANVAARLLEVQPVQMTNTLSSTMSSLQRMTMFTAHTPSGDAASTPSLAPPTCVFSISLQFSTWDWKHFPDPIVLNINRVST